jgi:hypothetical protein
LILKKLMFLLMIFLAGSPVAWSLDQEVVLAQRFENLIQGLDLMQISVDPKGEGVVPGMEGMSDAERVRMIAAYLFHQEGANPYSDHALTSLLNAYPDTLQNDGEFRRMLAVEEDPRRFHLLLVNMGGRFRVPEGPSLIREMAHMLLRDGAVGRAGGDYDSPEFHDVSRGAFDRIVSELEKHEASFEPPSRICRTRSGS